MSIKYPCPCPSCAKDVLVELKQAGQFIRCRHCGSRFETPKLRELKKLVRPDEAEVAESTIETAGQQKKSRVNGAIMALGIGLAMICGIAGAFVYSTASKLIPDISIEEALAIEAEGIRKASVNELFAVWENYYKDRHMAEWQESVIRSEMVQGNLLRKVSYVLFAVSALSLLAFIASLAGLGARKTAA